MTKDIMDLTARIVSTLDSLKTDLTTLHALLAESGGAELSISGECFALARTKSGHSQRSIAKILKRSQKDIWLLETGQKPHLSQSEAVQAAMALQVPLGYLTGADEAELPVGARIKRRRKALGLTQRDLAEKMGVDTSTICIWEKQGIDRLDEEKVRRLAAQLLVDYNDLIGSTHVPKKVPRLLKASG